MKELIKIAWRNLWLNKRRTLITIASIFFAIFFAILMRSFQLGTYGHMIKQSIESYSGYLQVQNPDYFDEPILDNSFEYTPELNSIIASNSNVSVAVPRIESFALASNGNQSKGVMISGISPELEGKLSNPYHKLVRFRFTADAIKSMETSGKISMEILKKIKEYKDYSFSSEARIELDLGLSEDDATKYLSEITKYSQVEANYLTETDKGVLISDRLSKFLKIGVGDSIVLIGQGYQGTSAAGVFPVRGIVKIPSPELDNKVVYMTLSNADSFFGLEGKITSVAINLKNTDDMVKTQKNLNAALSSDDFIIRNWEEVLPIMKQQIEGDNKSGQIFLAVIYFIVFFGIFGTVMMMVAERMREFGVMVAIGMKQRKLATIVAIEMIFMGLIGSVAGMAASIPILLYGHYNPIRLGGELAKTYEDMGFEAVMPLATFDPYFFMQGLIVIIMVLLACYIPVKNIMKINVIKAIHGQ